MICQSKGVFPLDIVPFQKSIADASIIIFMYPIWWSQMPAMMKGFIDRVFTNGFAFKKDESGVLKGLLTNKKVIIISSMSWQKDKAEEAGITKAFNLTLGKSIFNFCGMKIEHHIFIYSINNSSEYERKSWLKNLANYF